MRLAGGKECYRADCDSVTARGCTYTAEELATALDGPVGEIIRDDAGNATVEGILVGVADTGFGPDSVRRIVSSDRAPEDWRVGEALAECRLRDSHDCSFPWPSGRDQKNPDSSLPGADLVGFQKTTRKDYPHRFAFGEVKTSNEEKWPPQVMYGRHGLIQQLESLRDQVGVKDHLVKYLTHRASNATWKPKHKEAARRYLANPSDVALFGVLVRDVAPKEDDLRTRAMAMAKGCPRLTSVQLTAMYLPPKSIYRIGKRVGLGKEDCSARN
jgi:hypothetical protein